MTDDVAPPILQAIGLGRRSRTGDWLLRQATLTVRPGDRIALAGRSGSGKTLLMRAMARLDPIEEGEVRWRGKPIGGRRVAEFRSRVIYLPQRAHLVDGTVRENLE
ncbi:MAG: ATP-binding cassette domain-containing protein, partial [Planctomycetota bacterium]